MSYRCQLGDLFPVDGGEAAWEPCTEKAQHKILCAGHATLACRRHAEEVRDVADEIWPPLPAKAR